MKTRESVLVKTLVSLAITGLLSAAWAAHGVPRVPFAPGPGEPTLAEVRSATERFQDVKAALAEGYIRDPFDLCDTAGMMGQPASLGAMGVHYFRPDLLGITAPPSPRVDGASVIPEKATNIGADRRRRQSADRKRPPNANAPAAFLIRRL